VVNALTNKAEELVGGAEKKIEGKPVQRKGRPALTQAKEERDAVLAEKLKFKSITDWNRKLENMHTILTAENSTCKYIYKSFVNSILQSASKLMSLSVTFKRLATMCTR